jgi:hypothetical protein
VGSIICLTITRLNLSFAIGVILGFMEYSKVFPWKVVKRIMRYVKGSLNYKLEFVMNDEFKLFRYYSFDLIGCT